MRHNGPQILQSKHAVALISKIRKRIDALLEKMQKMVLTEAEVHSESHELIHDLEGINDHVKKMDIFGLLDSLRSRTHKFK